MKDGSAGVNRRFRSDSKLVTGGNGGNGDDGGKPCRDAARTRTQTRKTGLDGTSAPGSVSSVASCESSGPYRFDKLDLGLLDGDDDRRLGRVALGVDRRLARHAGEILRRRQGRAPAGAVSSYPNAAAAAKRLKVRMGRIAFFMVSTSTIGICGRGQNRTGVLFRKAELP